MKIIFFGSDDFALIHLEKLVQSEHQVVACVMQMDKPKGRGLRTEVSSIKQFALSREIELFQPAQLKDPSFIQQLKNFQSDLFVVVAYGKILPLEILSLPYLCCMNVHASLLPQYRGAAPINWAIINGESETGVSIIKMNSQMDAGDIFSQAEIKIAPEDTAVTLRSKMAALGSDLLLKAIDSLEKNDYTLTAQDNLKASTAPKLTKALGLIQWNKPAQAIHNLVRGLLPWPAAYTYYQGKVLKILQTEIVSADVSRKQPGEILELNPKGFLVAAADRGLLVRRVHLESAKAMDAKSFALGHKLQAGGRLR